MHILYNNYTLFTQCMNLSFLKGYIININKNCINYYLNKNVSIIKIPQLLKLLV